MNPVLSHPDTFDRRHIGPNPADIQAMCEVIGVESIDALVDSAVPSHLKSPEPLTLPGAGMSEQQALKQLQAFAAKNEIRRNYIGLGYHDTQTPPVIQRVILENPGWYTQYTPYQAEIAQGRLEMLLNFQTMVIDLTGLEIANASLLDEATAAGEAMSLSHAAASKKAKSERFFVDEGCHPQVIALVQTRAEPLNIEVAVGDPFTYDFAANPVFGAVLAYPATDGAIRDIRPVVDAVHGVNGLVTVASDLLALTLLTPPGELGADIVIGNSQRFGVPMGYGGPHAAFFATKETHKRLLPGRMIGVSKDADGEAALRMALQTREQHIRREKATSNICTAQVLLANVAAAYACYHGPEGLRRIATMVNTAARMLGKGVGELGYTLHHTTFFDTLRINATAEEKLRIQDACDARKINVRHYDDGIGVALDETVRDQDIIDLLAVFAAGKGETPELNPGALHNLVEGVSAGFEGVFKRTSDFMTHPVFARYHSETEMMRYLKRLESRDLSLTHSMIPLGSCTMKLNATAEMMPVTYPGFGKIHPFAPDAQTEGYREMLSQLRSWLTTITGFGGVSLMPNSGAQGEYAGLLVIREFLKHNGQGHRNVCLIPSSAHGTNPASAVMAGMKVVIVKCEENGDIDVADLTAKAEQHKDNLCALMATYPSTHGVFEDRIREICEVVHTNGGQVYMDGANLNAQVGLMKPGELGADVCHLNLHKTFCIPHGGGGPGMGPIGVAPHLVPFLPNHPLQDAAGGQHGIGPVSAAPFGSPSICTISWAYIAMMGAEGLTQATKVAILNANYMAKRLGEPYVTRKVKGQADRNNAILFARPNGRVAHEFILDTRPYDESAHINAEDIAKRLMDYGYHAPTMSWPVANTMMIEPTESESKAELDRFCEAMLSIREEIRAIEEGKIEGDRSPLKHAPHTAEAVANPNWDRAYTREQAAYPVPYLRDNKFWPAVARVDNVFGDRNIVCACPPIEEYEAAAAAEAEAATVGAS